MMCVRADWPGAELSAVGSQGFDPWSRIGLPRPVRMLRRCLSSPPATGPPFFCGFFGAVILRWKTLHAVS